jgi:hypothetical protein
MLLHNGWRSCLLSVSEQERAHGRIQLVLGIQTPNKVGVAVASNLLNVHGRGDHLQSVQYIGRIGELVGRAVDDGGRHSKCRQVVLRWVGLVVVLQVAVFAIVIPTFHVIGSQNIRYQQSQVRERERERGRESINQSRAYIHLELHSSQHLLPVDHVLHAGARWELAEQRRKARRVVVASTFATLVKHNRAR